MTIFVEYIFAVQCHNGEFGPLEYIKDIQLDQSETWAVLRYKLEKRYKLLSFKKGQPKSTFWARLFNINEPSWRQDDLWLDANDYIQDGMQIILFRKPMDPLEISYVPQQFRTEQEDFNEELNVKIEELQKKRIEITEHMTETEKLAALNKNEDITHKIEELKRKFWQLAKKSKKRERRVYMSAEEITGIPKTLLEQNEDGSWNYKNQDDTWEKRMRFVEEEKEE